MNVLYTAFKGKNNKSKVLLDYIDTLNKLYLTNSFKTSVKELEKALEGDNYDIVISFGQAPIDEKEIRIEIQAVGMKCYNTSIDYTYFKNKLEKEYNVVISNNAGNYLCNNIYYHGFRIINEKRLKAKILFIHIPKKIKYENIKKLARLFNLINSQLTVMG